MFEKLCIYYLAKHNTLWYNIIVGYGERKSGIRNFKANYFAAQGTLKFLIAPQKTKTDAKVA